MKAEGKIALYVLRHPVTLEIRYAGKANNAAKRLASHLRDSKRSNTPVYTWIRSLAKEGLAPIMEVVEEVSPEDWKKSEMAMIASLRLTQVRLLNVADGGDEPYCSGRVRAENGRNTALKRQANPRAKRIHELKMIMGRALSQGVVREETKAKLRLAAMKAPALFGGWASI